MIAHYYQVGGKYYPQIIHEDGRRENFGNWQGMTCQDAKITAMEEIQKRKAEKFKSDKKGIAK